MDKNTNNTMIKLSQPTILDGVEYTELAIREITAADIEKYGSAYAISADKSIKIDYAVAARIAEACCGLTEGELKKLPVKDYIQVCGVILSFLG